MSHYLTERAVFSGGAGIITLKSRHLKIEATGDFFAGKVIPKIRLSGHWLKCAGFDMGGRVEVRHAGQGRLEIVALGPAPAVWAEGDRGSGNHARAKE